MTESLDQEARRLHQSIYGPISDKDWFEINDIWIANIDWLRNNQDRTTIPVDLVSKH